MHAFASLDISPSNTLTRAPFGTFPRLSLGCIEETLCDWSFIWKCTTRSQRWSLDQSRLCFLRLPFPEPIAPVAAYGRLRQKNVPTEEKVKVAYLLDSPCPLVDRSFRLGSGTMGTKNGNKKIFSKSFPVNVRRRSNLREVENGALEFAYLRVRPLCYDKEYQTGRNTKRQKIYACLCSRQGKAKILKKM